MYRDWHRVAHTISIPTLREEGDLLQLQSILDSWRISIPTLREEGDRSGAMVLPVDVKISIPTLREEGDLRQT